MVLIPVAVPPDEVALIVNCCIEGGLTMMGIDAIPTFSLNLLLPLTKPI